MFDHWISLALVAEAYELNKDECFYFVQYVPRKPASSEPARAPRQCNPDRIKSHIMKRARQLAENTNQAEAHCIFHAVRNHGLRFRQDGFDMLAQYKSCWERGDKEAAAYFLAAEMEWSFIINLRIDKVAIVRCLATTGKPHKHDVEGLTKVIADGITNSPSVLKESHSAKKETPDFISVTIDIRPWAGKTAKVAYEALKGVYEDDLIALIMEETCKSSTKLAMALQLLPTQSDDDSRVKQFNRMVKRARKRYKITYE